jgi:hypothetical protein
LQLLLKHIAIIFGDACIVDISFCLNGNIISVENSGTLQDEKKVAMQGGVAAIE